MSVFCPDAGAIRLLELLLSEDPANIGNLSLRLFGNDYTPDPSSVTGDFVEPEWIGYYRQTLERASWGVPTIDAGRAVVEYDGPPLSWTNNSGGTVTVYGYTVVDPVTEITLWCERADTSRVLAPGEELTVAILLTGRSEV